MRISDFSDLKVPAITKAKGTQASVSLFDDASGGRSSRNESGVRDIFGVGYMRGGHNQNSQGPERAERAGEISGIPGNVIDPHQATRRENSDQRSTLPHLQRNRRMRRTSSTAR